MQAASKPPAERNPEAEAALRQQFMETGAHLDALEARIAREFPAYAELSNPKPLELAEAQALLAPDEAMLVYLVGTDETWLWALRRDRAALYRIKTGAKALAAEVAALRNRLDPALNPDLAPFDTKRAFALYQDILAPAAPLLDGARQVFIVPDGALESLPLGVLVTQASETDPRSLSDYRDIAWFARDHALTVLPSVGALRALRKFASGTSAAAPFVGIGNPVLEGTSERGARASNSPACFAVLLPTLLRFASCPHSPRPLTSCGRSPRQWGLATGISISPSGPQNRCCARPGSTATGSSSSRRMG